MLFPCKEDRRCCQAEAQVGAGRGFAEGRGGRQEVEGVVYQLEGVSTKMRGTRGPRLTWKAMPRLRP